MKERVAIVEGIRTPFCKAGGVLKEWEADDLGAFIVNELMARSPVSREQVDELIFGNVLQPPHATNIARVLAVKGGLPISIPAYTVNRNCASGMESVVSAALKIINGDLETVVAGGCESMSHFPILFKKEMRDWIQRFSRSRNWKQKLSALFSFRPSFLVPQIPEIADPLCALNMGQTAENLVRDFHITRKDQDLFALMSQNRASLAIKEKRLQEEIAPIPLPPKFVSTQEVDDGPRDQQTLEALAKLKPAFDKLTGSVTAGTSSQVTDGACALLIMKESKVKALGLKPLAYVKAYAEEGLDPSRMGLGPAFAIQKVLKETGYRLEEMELIEINEAFAAQVIAVERALASEDFCQKHFGSPAVGEIDRNILNVNGGAIALGHPLGASGARLILTLAKEMQRRGAKRGLCSLCIGGGQGQAMILEAE